MKKTRFLAVAESAPRALQLASAAVKNTFDIRRKMANLSRTLDLKENL